MSPIEIPQVGHALVLDTATVRVERTLQGKAARCTCKDGKMCTYVHVCGILQPAQTVLSLSRRVDMAQLLL